MGLLNSFCTYAIAVQTFSPNHWNNQKLKLEELTVIYNSKIARLLKRGWTEEQAKNHLILVMLDCWPVNLSAITKQHVLDKCPGMELMFIPAGGTGRYQINDTDLHKPFKDSVRFEACAWYRSMLKTLKANVFAGMLTEETFVIAVGKLMSMGTLRNKAPEWANQAIRQLTKKGIDRLDCPTMNAASIIKYAWYRLYIKFAGNPEFQDAAVLRIAAREASKLAADATAAAAVVLAAAAVVKEVAVEGVALNRENWNVALVGIDLSSISTDALVAHCGEMERKAHMAEIPSHRNSKRKAKGKRRGNRQASRAEKYQ